MFPKNKAQLLLVEKMRVLPVEAREVNESQTRVRHMGMAHSVSSS